MLFRHSYLEESFFSRKRIKNKARVLWQIWTAWYIGKRCRRSIGETGPGLRALTSGIYLNLNRLNYCVCVCLCVFVCAHSVTQSCPTSVTPWAMARQAPLLVEFSRQEYWSRLPFPTPGDLPELGIELSSFASPALTRGFFPTAPYLRELALILSKPKVYVPSGFPSIESWLCISSSSPSIMYQTLYQMNKYVPAFRAQRGRKDPNYTNTYISWWMSVQSSIEKGTRKHHSGGMIQGRRYKYMTVS